MPETVPHLVMGLHPARPQPFSRKIDASRLGVSQADTLVLVVLGGSYRDSNNRGGVKLGRAFCEGV
jgi:hypothetical protein